jgi:thiopeptide-type bacteriocin biosynthesis protein
MALQANRDRRLAVELTDELLARLQTWSPTPDTAPLSFELSLFLAARSAAALDAGDFQVIVGPNLGASAAGRNLGRFADLLGAEANVALRRVVSAESPHARGRPFAELVYLPARMRSANVAIRPPIRDYEIALGTTPGVEPTRIIPLGELVVGVKDARFYVRWPMMNTEVLVCAGHMLNPLHAPPIARFLDEVARDGRVQLGPFDWGPAAGFAFLPRVQYGRIVLALAEWRIDSTARADELPAEPRRAFHDALPTWRARWSVPRHVYLAIGDNRLLLDLEQPAQADQLREELRGLADGQSLLVQEALPGPQDAWLPGPEGRYMTELVVPIALRPDLAGDEGVEIASRAGGNRATRADSRLRPPGSDWLFLKLYCPTSLEEELIAGPVRNFSAFVTAAGLAISWFFVRYADPDPHLRLRFSGNPDVLLGRLLPEACSWARDLIANGACVRFAIDTYDRELERYGGVEATSVAETIFAADSIAVAELMWLSRGQPPALDRTALVVLTIDDLLASLGLSESERLSWYRERISLSRADGLEYRDRKQALRRLLGSPNPFAGDPRRDTIAQILADRRQALAPCADRLDMLAQRGELGQSAAWLFRSYVHMHSNRLLGNGSPIEERALQLLRRVREGLSQAPME